MTTTTRKRAPIGPHINKYAKVWLEALWEGDRRQTEFSLRDERGFCCLGVACDIFKNLVSGEWRRVEPENREPGASKEALQFLSCQQTLPQVLVELLNLNNAEGKWENRTGARIPHHYARSLTELNDTGFTHFDIANALATDAGYFREDTTAD